VLEVGAESQRFNQHHQGEHGEEPPVFSAEWVSQLAMIHPKSTKISSGVSRIGSRKQECSYQDFDIFPSQLYEENLNHLVEIF